MIWTLRVECVFGLHLEEEWVRVFEIESGASLYDVHDTIQDASDFDRDHLFEFYAGRNPRNRKVVFEDSDEWEDRLDTYADLTLENVYPLDKGLKLYYLFDFGDSWLFEIKKSRKKPKQPEAGVEYPRVIERVGANPPQYGRYEEE